MKPYTDLSSDEFSESRWSTINPMAVVLAWYHWAEETEINDPGAVCLASVGPTGVPSARMVLCRKIDSQGLVFYTNSQSRKGQQLEGFPAAAMCFYWKSIKRQIRIEGLMTHAGEDLSDDYFHSRHRGSQIGAWASFQSQVLPSREVLNERMKHLTQEHENQDIPRPEHWLGYRLIPNRIEFWQEETHRLHYRLEFLRQTDGWQVQRLYP